MTQFVVNVPYITTDEDAERLFGKGSELAGMTKLALCEQSGHRNKSKSCPTCARRRREAARGDWFAAEERLGR